MLIALLKPFRFHLLRCVGLAEHCKCECNSRSTCLYMLECPSDPPLAAGFGNSLVLFALGCLSIMGFKQKTVRTAAPLSVR